MLHQPARGEGYRVNADALLLAHFAGASRGTLFDLGAGVGAVALVMIARGFASRAVLVDADRTACALAKRNVEANAVGAEVAVGDVLEVARERRGQAALVVSNPPYFAPGKGRVSKASAPARTGDLDRFVVAAREVLGRRGRVCFVYPASDLARLVAAFRAVGLEPKRLRLVHSRASAPARIALLEARATKPGGLVVEAPLVERDGPRASDYSVEAARALGLRA